MALDDVAPGGAEDPRTRWISIWIGVLAVLLAVCAMGGDNATKDANKANVDAANLWAFFQAKNIRRHMLNLRVEEMELQLATFPQIPADARRQIEAKIAEHKATTARLTSDKQSNEGLDELFQRAKATEEARESALRKDPYFDWSQALLQIAIVLASVSIVARSGPLLYASLGLGGLGSVLTLIGFVL